MFKKNLLKIIICIIIIGFILNKLNFSGKGLQRLGIMQEDDTYFDFLAKLINIILSIAVGIIIPTINCIHNVKPKENEKPHISLTIKDMTVSRKMIRKDNIREIVIGNSTWLWFIYVDIIVENTGQNVIKKFVVNGEDMETGVMSQKDQYTFRLKIYKENGNALEGCYSIKLEYIDASKHSYKEDLRLKIDENNLYAAFEIDKGQRRCCNWI